MKTNKFIAFACGVALAVGAASCSKSKAVVAPSSAAYAQGVTTCMGAEGDGSQTVRAWGKGSNTADAVEQALKNAVYDVIFQGVQGTGGCNANALVTEVNARERYAQYFDPFFADGGEYKKFVKEDKAPASSRIVAKGTAIVNIGVVATVDRTALRRQLVEDGVLQ